MQTQHYKSVPTKPRVGPVVIDAGLVKTPKIQVLCFMFYGVADSAGRQRKRTAAWVYTSLRQW